MSNADTHSNAPKQNAADIEPQEPQPESGDTYDPEDREVIRQSSPASERAEQKTEEALEEA